MVNDPDYILLKELIFKKEITYIEDDEVDDNWGYYYLPIHEALIDRCVEKNYRIKDEDVL